MQIEYYDRPQLMMPLEHGVKLFKDTAYDLNGKRYKLSEDTIVNIPRNLSVEDIAEKELYLYAVETSTPQFVISLNPTVPDYYSEKNSRLLGGFLCSGYDFVPNPNEWPTAISKGMVNPFSCWDLKFRPNCDPRGMIYIKDIDCWVDVGRGN